MSASAKSQPRVAVLMGGPSGEHAISLKSGRGVAEALAQQGWMAEPIIIPQTPTLADAATLTAQALTRARPDVVFIALHGAFGEDGSVQQVCEDLHLPYTGSDVQASRLGMDKVASRQRFEAAGLAVPRWRLVDLSVHQPTSLEGFTYPLVVKPPSEGSSLGVSIVRSPEALPAAFAEAGRYGARVLVEAFVAGREVTVGVLGDEALPIVEIHPHQAFFDFTAKYTSGATDYIVPAPLPPAVARTVQEAGLAAHRALGCRHLSRTDLILASDGIPVILEVNTIPGFTPTSLLPKAAACVGVSYEALCEQLVMMALAGASHTAPA